MNNIHGEEVIHTKVILEVFRVASDGFYHVQYDSPASHTTRWAGRCLHCGFIHMHGYSHKCNDGLFGLGSRSCHCSTYDVHEVEAGSHPTGWYFLVPDRTRPFPEEIDRKVYKLYLKRISKETNFDMTGYRPSCYPVPMSHKPATRNTLRASA